MSDNPFIADPATARRIAEIDADCGAEVRAEIDRLAPRSAARLGTAEGGILRAADAAEIIGKYGLADVSELMLLGLDVARSVARPPISDFFVGAIGLERETGNLVLGGNVEFPGTHLGTTLHGEGFVATRAYNRGTSIARIALGEAHPCAHCRQYLSEFDIGPDLELVDLLGHRLRLSDLYPWPFDTRYLNAPGATPQTDHWPSLTPSQTTISTEKARLLVSAGKKAHAPYSKCPGAVLLDLADRNAVTGAGIESVAFNPTIPPLQAALIDLLAHGYAYQDIVRATLGTVSGGAVDYEASTRELLKAIAPAAKLDIVNWSV